MIFFFILFLFVDCRFKDLEHELRQLEKEKFGGLTD